MFSVGETLKRARQAQSLDLDAVAARTRINIKYLAAIEADDRTEFPSGFFYKSFVDQYARCLSLDTQEIDAEIDRALSADAPLPLPGYESVVARNISPLKQTRRFPRWRSFASAALLLLTLAGCSGMYVMWRHWKPIERLVVSVHKARATTPPAPAADKARVIKPEASPTLADALKEAVRPPTYKVWLEVLAHEATWLSVSTDGKPVFSGVLQVNQSKMVGGQRSAKMRVGNAAGIEVHLNGKRLAPLGERGQVLEVLFTPDHFRIISPTKAGD